jgi:patatin-like phospholipase/acyl hydrolase
MKPFRKHVAIAIDGGGIRGLIVTRALAALEAYLGQPVHDIFRLAAGTSTGSIISAGIAAGLSAARMSELYQELGASIFPFSLRKLLFPLTRYRYSSKPFEQALANHFGNLKMGDIWSSSTRVDLVVTAYDLQENRTRFVKPWKEEYAEWPVLKAVLASCTVPTYFPAVEQRFIDGGVGAYSNPCYVAAYEARECMEWDPAETTLISIGTGRNPYEYSAKKIARSWAWDWIGRVLNVFSQSSYDQQVHLVETFFNELDFRRFQIDLQAPIEMDDVRRMDELAAYGEYLGQMILNDETDPIQGINLKNLDAQMRFR